MLNNHCDKCGKQIKLKNNKWQCANLVCINYNVQVRRNRANKQKRYEKVIQAKEEE